MRSSRRALRRFGTRYWQAPATQICPAAQAVPHEPQCVESIERSVHRHALHPSRHDVRPALHPHAHDAPAQTDPGRHSFPHAPQLRGSVVRSTQLAPQATRPGEHPPSTFGEYTSLALGHASPDAESSRTSVAIEASATSVASETVCASIDASPASVAAIASTPASIPSGTVHAGSANTPTVSALQPGTVQNQWPSLHEHVAANEMNRPVSHIAHDAAMRQNVFGSVHAPVRETSAPHAPRSMGAELVQPSRAASESPKANTRSAGWRRKSIVRD